MLTAAAAAGDVRSLMLDVTGVVTASLPGSNTVGSIVEALAIMDF